jgi:hypothetical protein
LIDATPFPGVMFRAESPAGLQGPLTEIPLGDIALPTT